jgi:hypothetical protein
MSASTGEVPGRIFMTYRREDTSYPAAWLFDRLASHFGREQVFKDIDSIELGDDFVEVITAAVGSCDALLALIGNRWLTTIGQNGQRRLDDPGDFVRLEIEAALARNVRVIPILVEGAQMPRADELPASLAKLARRQALELSPARFDADTRRLLRVLDRTITQAKEQARQNAAAAERRRQVGQLQQQMRDRAAARDWDAVVVVSDRLAGLDPAAADPDGLAGMAREQITRRQEAELPAAGTQQPADDLPASRAELPQADTPPRLDAPGDPRPHSAALQSESSRPAEAGTAAARADAVAPATIDPAFIGEPWWAAAPTVARATSQPPGKPEMADVSGWPPGEMDVPTADAEASPSAAKVHPVGFVRSRFSIYREQLARHLRRPARHLRHRAVIISLAVLLAVVIGGGFLAWRWTQSQYYVGADSRGQVVIYRGVNQQIAGISLSQPYQQTGIVLAQVPSPYQQTLKATDAASSLSGARAIVANVQTAVSTCRQAYLDRQAWVAKENAYRAYLAAAVVANKQHKKPPPAVANPGPQPPPAGSGCPPSTVFGVAAADLVPSAGAS